MAHLHTLMLALIFTGTLLFSAVSCGGGVPLEKDKSLQIRRIGLSWLGVQNASMSCEWIKAYEDTPNAILAFLWGSFGFKRECLDLFSELDQPKIVNIYLSNGSCERKSICTSFDGVGRVDIINHTIEALQMFPRQLGLKLILTIGLEDNYNAVEACQIYDLIDDTLNLYDREDVEIWRNPNVDDGAYDCFDGVELHNQRFTAEPRDCAYSNDGADLDIGNTIWNLPNRVTGEEIAAQVKTEVPGCIVYLWAADGNCIDGDTATQPNPGARQCMDDGPTIKELNQLIKDLS